MKKEVIIEINGQNLIFPLGIGFIGQCIENLGTTTTELFQKMDDNAFKWSTDAMYESLKYQYEDELKFSKKEFLSYLDEDAEGLKKIGNFNVAFIRSLNPNLPISNEPKKKVKSQKK